MCVCVCVCVCGVCVRVRVCVFFVLCLKDFCVVMMMGRDIKKIVERRGVHCKQVERNVFVFDGDEELFVFTFCKGNC